MLKGEQIVRALPFLAFMDVRDIAISADESMPCLHCPIQKECDGSKPRICTDVIENYIWTGDINGEDEE